MPTSALIPLLCAFVYAIAALMVKRATEEGAGPWRVLFIANWMFAIFSAPLWLLPSEHPAALVHVWHAFLCGALFFFGQAASFLALSRGDVSVATPVLGSKVIFVALFTVLLGTVAVSPAMWLAVMLTAAATTLLGMGPRGETISRDALFRTLLYGFGAATAFALTDVFQQRWVKLWGFAPFVAVIFLSNAILSLTLLPIFRGSFRTMPRASWPWALAGSFLLALQCCGFAWAIFTLGATTSNILYNSRGIWSVALVWTIGHWFGNRERSHGRAVMWRRMAASALLVVAIVLATSR